jgi:hypothetical protein
MTGRRLMASCTPFLVAVLLVPSVVGCGSDPAVAPARSGVPGSGQVSATGNTVTTFRFDDDRISDVDLGRDLDPAWVLARPPPDVWTRQGWRPEPSLSMDDQLPQPWPEQYVKEFEQPFNPYTYMTTAAVLCAYDDSHPEDHRASEALAEQLFERLLDYTKSQNGALFVIYDFQYDYEGHVQAPGWVSGFGNGTAIAGTLALYECWPSARKLEVAYALADAYNTTNRDGEAMWFTRVTEDDFAWFEEIAIDEPQMILNGHIMAIMGLYYLWDRHGQDGGVERMLRAGIAAAHEYVPDFRRPGMVSCYDLSPPCHDDYGPERAVIQQDILWEMTGDPVFRDMRDALAEDMNIDVTKYSAHTY